MSIRSAIVKNSSDPDDRQVMGEAGVHESMKVGEATIFYVVHRPGWRWSTHIKPSAGTEWCERTHVGYVLSGRERCRLRDGTEFELGPGDAFLVPPGHDAWVVGDEPYLGVNFSGHAD